MYLNLTLIESSAPIVGKTNNTSVFLVICYWLTAVIDNAKIYVLLSWDLDGWKVDIFLNAGFGL